MASCNDPPLYDGLLFMVNVSTPWSEVEEGMQFQTWWDKQVKDSSPKTRREPEVCGQQCEWVTAQSSRAGVNGLLKPFSGLDPKLRIGEQPSGSGTVKLVVRPVCLEDTPVNLGKLESDESMKRALGPYRL